MDGVLLGGVLVSVFLVPLVALLLAAWRHGGEQSPEREPDGPPMERDDAAYLAWWSQSNRWQL